jgi:hypothetical protein
MSYSKISLVYRAREERASRAKGLFYIFKNLLFSAPLPSDSVTVSSYLFYKFDRVLIYYSCKTYNSFAV